MSKGVVNKNPPKWLDDIAEYMEEKAFHGNIITIRDGMFFLRNNWLDFKGRCDSIYEEKKKQKKPKNTSNKEKNRKKRKRDDDEDNMSQEENIEEEKQNGGNSVGKESNSTQSGQKKDENEKMKILRKYSEDGYIKSQYPNFLILEVPLLDINDINEDSKNILKCPNKLNQIKKLYQTERTSTLRNEYDYFMS